MGKENITVNSVKWFKMEKHNGHFKPAGQEPRRGKGGKRPGAGRPSKYDEELRARAVKRIEAKLERRLDAALKTYDLVAAKGVLRKRFNPKTGEVYFEREYDTATLRHWIDKFLPTLHKQELAGKDGRPLVPVTIVAPDPYAEEPIPEQQKKEAEKALPERPKPEKARPK